MRSMTQMPDESIRVGRFTVLRTPLIGACCNRYDVYVKGQYLSSQCSLPNKMQCETLALEGAAVKTRRRPAALANQSRRIDIQATKAAA